MEKGSTYYMRFGFVPEPLQHNTCEIPFNNKEEWHTKVNKIFRKINKIKISDIIEKYDQILKLVIAIKKNQDFQNLKIKYLVFPSLKPYNFYLEENPKARLDELERVNTSILKT